MTRPELLVLTGLHPPGVEAVISGIRALDRSVAALHHDLREIGSGRVHRRLRRGGPHDGTDERTVVELAHGCVSCTCARTCCRSSARWLRRAGRGGSSCTSTRPSTRSRSAGRC